MQAHTMTDDDPKAREQAEALATDLDQNRRMMADCPECGKRPTLEYLTGVTWGGCCGHRVTLPDWEPKRVRELWNERVTKSKK